MYEGIFDGFIEIDGFVDGMRDGIDDGVKVGICDGFDDIEGLYEGGIFDGLI